jgi:ferredoxin
VNPAATRASRRSTTGFDLLRVPVLGRFLGWRHARTCLQVPLLLLGLLVLDDGFFGPQLAPENFAGVLPWVQWRGFLVLGLLVLGNVFCMSCPFMLPRRLAKRYLPANRPWPTWLRGKWLAVVLLIAFFYAYEAFALWASPLLTAWVALAYFLTAIVVDGFFRGAAFCKYVCPIGQFNFVSSLASPFEVRVREPDVCERCTTKDCIHGRYGEPVAVARPTAPRGQALPMLPAAKRRPIQNGCELWLFQPQKVGNFDCTFCLDCIHACPHDNVGIIARQPAAELGQDVRRSGIGRLADRPDIAVLVIALVFGAFMNAFGMVGPFAGFETAIAGVLHSTSAALVLLVIFGTGFVLGPAVVVTAAAAVSRALSGSSESIGKTATRFSYGLVPMSFGMWLAHYGFHFMVGALTIVPVAQSFLSDFGLPLLGAPQWGLAELVPLSWTLWIELTLLELGLFGSLLTVARIAGTGPAARVAAWRSALPWWLVAFALFAAGWWLLHQPMQMRGTFLVSGFGG